jgi:hypothetical protein
MRSLIDSLRELVGLFVDDGSLAIALIVWLVAIGVAVRALPAEAGLIPALLVLGVLAILLENVARTARARRR